MATSRTFTSASCVLLGLVVAAAFVLPVRADAEGADDAAVAVLCEAWRVTDPGLIGEIEALTDRDPGAAEAVRKALREGGADRVARILTPAVFGELAQFSDLREIAQVFSKTTPQGTTSTGIAGFHEIGTRLEVKPASREGGRIRFELDLRMTGRGPAPDTDPIRSRTSTHIHTTLAAPLDVWRLSLSRAADADVVVIFVRASALDEIPAASDESGPE